MKTRALILVPFLVFPSLIAGQAQSSTPLQQGIPIERALEAHQVHEFTVNAKENTLVQLVVEQKGVDVVVKVSSPDGKSLADFDTPNGSQGFEQVSFVAPKSGEYVVAVLPLNDEAANGRYEIKLIEAREATAEEIEITENRRTSKAKGIALLLELRDPISQIRSHTTRINAQLKAASLLKDIDEKNASKYLLDAVADLKVLLAAAETNELDVEGNMMELSHLAQMREEVIRNLAATDPDAALSFLYSTKPRYSFYGGQGEVMANESALELSIADQIALKDPNRALQIARQNLKKAYSPSLMTTASTIFQKNPELAAELVHEMTSKILGEEKLLNKAEAASLAVMLASYYGGVHNRLPVNKNDPDSTPIIVGMASNKDLVSEQEYKQLIQKMVRELLTFTLTPNGTENNALSGIWIMLNGLTSFGNELDKVVSGSLAALEKKQKELAGNYENTYLTQIQELQNSLTNNSTDAALEIINKSPAETKEQLYMMLAMREANNGDVTRAKQIINDQISNPYQRAHAIRMVEQQEITQATSNGKIEEALKNIAGIRSATGRAKQLSQLASQIGSGRKRATALSLLEQARNLLPASPTAADQVQMGALLDLARAFSPYDSKRSFEIIDPLIDQFNDICAAARTLDGFGMHSFDNDELNLHNEEVLAQLAGQMSNALGSLALINFDRAKTASDKLNLPEVRLHVYLQIAEQTITAKQ